MALLGSLWKLISKIISKIFKFIADIFGELFWIILIIVLIYFAPVIAAWLASVGAPAFLVSAFEVLSLATPYVVSAVEWVWSGGKALVSAGWSAFSDMSVGQKAAVILGAAALVAPEETQAVIGDAADLVGKAVSSVASGVLSSPIGLIATGVCAWLLFGKKKEKDKVVLDVQQSKLESNNG